MQEASVIRSQLIVSCLCSICQQVLIKESVLLFVGGKARMCSDANLIGNAQRKIILYVIIFCLVWGVPSGRVRKGEAAEDAGFVFCFICFVFVDSCCAFANSSPERGCSPPRPSYVCWGSSIRTRGSTPPCVRPMAVRSAHVRREFVRAPSRCRSCYSSYGRIPREAAGSKFGLPALMDLWMGQRWIVRR